MLTLRFVLAILLIVMGSVIDARMLALGARLEILPGVALGLAMIALGVHRLGLIARVRRDA
jgi:hypothetical protein